MICSLQRIHSVCVKHSDHIFYLFFPEYGSSIVSVQFLMMHQVT